MTPTVSFKELLSIMATRLGEAGFRRKGGSFYLREGGNWGVVNFQKSGKSTTDVILFTVNVGIASGVLLNFSGLRESDVPRIDQCHWRKRLGFFFAEPSDTWWRIDATASLSAIAQEIIGALLQLAIPEMKRYLSDASLLELWASGVSPGLTEVERLKYLSVLLKMTGKAGFLDEVRNTLRTISKGRPYAGMVALHLDRLDKVRHDQGPR
jgi:Domain of unknown function (DUF4304)